MWCPVDVTEGHLYGSASWHCWQDPLLRHQRSRVGGLARLQNNGPMMLFNRNMKLLRFSSDDSITRPAAASFNSDKMEIHQIPGSR